MPFNPWSFLDGYFWYLGPYAFCKNKYFDHPRHPYGLGALTLPFESLPPTNADDLLSESAETDQLVLPPDGWKAMLGCFSCGLVETYDADDVDSLIVPKTSEGVFHSDGACICVEARCVEGCCRLPAKWYVDIGDSTETELQQRLRKNLFFGDLPCGHQLRTCLDQNSLRTYRVMNRLWHKS